MGGLLLDANWNFTAAVEAFELTKEEKGHRFSDLMEVNGFSKGLYMAGVFAKRLEIPFYLIGQSQEDGLLYMQNSEGETIRPGDNIFTALDEIQKWFQGII